MALSGAEPAEYVAAEHAHEVEGASLLEVGLMDASYEGVLLQGASADALQADA